MHRRLQFFFYDIPFDLETIEKDLEIIEKNFHTTIKNVVRETKWAPEIIGALFFDDIDYLGIDYWNNDIIQVNGELKPKKPTT